MKSKIKKSIEGIKGLFKNNIRLTKLAWKYRKDLVLGSIVTSAILAFLPFLRSGAFAVFINDLVKTVSNGITTTLDAHLVGLLVLAITLSVVPQFFYVLKGILDRRFWFVMTEKIDLMFLEKKGKIDVSTYEDPKFNDLLVRAENHSIYPIPNLLESQFYNVQNIVGVIVASVILASINWQIFVILLIGSLPKFIVELLYGQMIWGIFDSESETQRRYFDVRSHFNRLETVVELKLFQNVRHMYRIVEKLVVDFNKAQMKIERRKFINELLAIVVSMSTEALALVILVLSVIKGNVEVGTMTFVLASMYELQNSLSGFFLNIASQYKTSLFVTDLFKVFDTPQSMSQALDPVVLDVEKAPRIEFENVSFAYPGSNRLVLKNVSLVIEPGGKLAVVGINGSGKTTMVKLLCRFYDPTEGRILINGHDLRDIDLDSWYYLMGVLFQDYATYRFLTKDSIGIGRTDNGTDFEKVKSAALLSESDNFIQEWPKQYDQMIGKEFTGGIDPSKGQLQKLALARTFYRDPKFLILDEPTASIDAEAEAKIFERLETLPADRTVILISHRFSTVRKASKICVIENGTVSELGTHRELLVKDGTYARLFKLQAAGYQD